MLHVAAVSICIRTLAYEEPSDDRDNIAKYFCPRDFRAGVMFASGSSEYAVLSSYSLGSLYESYVASSTAFTERGLWWNFFREADDGVVT